MFRTDDPIRDYDRFIAECEKELEHLPKCDICDCPIVDDYAYDLDGTLVCQECLDMHYKRIF